MDPSHWNNLNQQYAARLGAAGVPTASAGIPFLDQHSFTPGGLGALSAPLGPHVTLAATHLPGIPHMSYSHALTGSSVTQQILDTLAAGQVAAHQMQYKTFAVGQPSYNMDSLNRTPNDGITRFSTQSLFDTDPHTMKEPMGGHAGVQPPANVNEAPKNWTLSNFLTAQGSGLFGLSSEGISNPSPRVTQAEPPPAHSGRPSTIQRNLYQSKTDSSSMSSDGRPPQAHSNNYGQHPPVAHSHNTLVSFPNLDHLRGPARGQFHETRPSIDYQSIDRSHSLSSHSSYSGASPSLANPQTSYPDSPLLQQQNPCNYQPNNQTKRVPLQTPSSYSGSYTSSVADTINYDPVSPPSSVSRNNHGISLEDFAGSSSHQQRIPTSSPAQIPTRHQDSARVNDGNHSHNLIGHSPSHSSESSTVINPSKNAIQAVADSTTKPKRGGRRKKSSIAVSEGNHQIGSYSTISDNLGLSHLGHQSAMITTLPLHHQASMPEMEQPIFMTNTFGSSFVKPQGNHASDQKSGDVRVQEINKLPIQFEHEKIFSQMPHKHKMRTKAEQKQMPSDVAGTANDKEFAHLVPLGKSKVDDKCSGKKLIGHDLALKPESQYHTKKYDVIENPSPNMNKKAEVETESVVSKKSMDSSFQCSFMSFLLGKKQETLSSVTNSAITAKPDLPKYIPEKRAKMRDLGNQSRTSVTRDSPQVRPLNEPKIEPPRRSAVNEEVVKSEKSPHKTVKETLDDIKLTPKMTVKAPMYKIISGPSPNLKAKIPSSAKKRKPSLSEKVKPMTDEVIEFLHDDVLPPRTKSSRKAKEKVSRKRKSEKTQKTRSNSDELSEGEEYYSSSTPSEPESKDYDSDKDPVWTPYAENLPRENDSEKRTSFKRSVASESSSKKSKSSLSRKLNTQSDVETDSSYPPSPTQPLPVTEEVLDYLSDDEEPPHIYQKGSFVLDRRDLDKMDSYPIWKIDSGRLLQKFESFLKDGHSYHKSLSTYSSWSDNIRERYKAIGVHWIKKGKDRDQDIVQVLPYYQPKKVEESLEENPRMLAFNVYVQILVSHALEPGFLTAIMIEEDTYYSKPTRIIDSLLNDVKSKLAVVVNWSPNLKDSMDKYPYLSTGQTNQMQSPDPSRPFLKVVKLSGCPYDRHSLDDEASDESNPDDNREFLISSTASDSLKMYHSLHHFKYILYKRCKSKVALLRGNGETDQSNILDHCLQNRRWVHKLFHNFETLLQCANGCASAGSSVPACSSGLGMPDKYPEARISTEL